MKLYRLTLLTLALVAALLQLWLWDGDGVLQNVYLWIAEQENAARGIDGITEASRLKVMDDAVRHFPIYKKIATVIVPVVLLFCWLAGKRRLERKEH